MINLKKALLLLTLMTASLGASAATTMMDWNVVAGPITSVVSPGGTVSTVEAKLFDSSNTEIASGSIDDFNLTLGSAITGFFTGAAGTYSIIGNIIDFPVITVVSGFAFYGITADGDINSGSVVMAPGSSSLNLAGSSINFTAVPVPAAAWLFGSGLIGLVAVARRRK